jgi:hypothetical protein
MATIHINRGGTNLGTFSEEEVRAGLRAARFMGTDLGWREGMPAWQPLSQFSEFAADLAAASVPAAEPPPSDVPPPPTSTGTVPAAITASPAPPPAQSVTPRSGLPWDRRVELGLLKAFIETLQMTLARPSAAFTAMKREGGLWEPLLYALIGGTFGTVVNFIYRFGLQAVTGDAFTGGNWNRTFGSIGILFLIIFSPLLVILGTFLAAGIIHLCLLMVGGARHPFETTFRVVCFTTGSVNPLQIVPFCGTVIAGVWGIVLYCIGLARAHETDTGRAVLAVFLPLVICCGGVLLLFVLLGGIGILSHSWH